MNDFQKLFEENNSKEEIERVLQFPCKCCARKFCEHCMYSENGKPRRF